MRSGPELQLHKQVTELAEILGWEWMAVRPMFDVKRKVYRTGTIGTMAKGWPDLVLVRSRDRRIIFAELKGDKRSKTTPDQERVLDVMRELTLDGMIANSVTLDPAEYQLVKIDVFVWRPEDWPEIEIMLR
jgi:hypothetical protein